jgi:hypothetical protein|nr:MAG TPA_asm: hypothetical protein [Caudoviricetes sp.]
MAVAKRKKNSQRANNLKRNAAIRSAQVRRERAVRDYSTGRLPKQITETFLGNLSAQQLEQVARRLGQEFGEQQQALRVRDNEPYQVVPDVHVTKLDREMASRPLITDAEIAAAPSKRRKTLRQQQRRRVEARQKIKRAQQFEALSMASYTVGEMREMERAGESPFDVLGTHTVGGSARDELMRSRANVFGTERGISHARAMIREGGRKRLEREMFQYAGLVGRAPLRAGTSQIPKNEGVSDFDKAAQQLEAFDSSVAQKFASLSNRQKRWLMNNTNFSVVVREATWYNDKAHKWETKADAGDVETRLDEWMTSAARH